MILAALLLSAQPPGDAPADPVTFDLQCMLVSADLRENANPEMRAVGDKASHFFFGRVSARLAEAEIETGLWREVQAMPGRDRQAMLRACGEFMAVQGTMLARVGRGITVREEAATQR